MFFDSISVDADECPMLVCSLDNQKIIKANKEFERRFGVSSEIVGSSLKHIKQPILSERFTGIRNDKYGREYVFLNINNTRKELVELIYPTQNEEGQNEFAIIVCQLFKHTGSESKGNCCDLTLDRKDDIVLLVNSQGKIQQVNSAACKKLGFNREEFFEMEYLELVHRSIREFTKNKWSRFLRTGQAKGEYLLTKKDGRSIFVEFRAVANVRLGLHLIVLRDIATVDQKVRREKRYHETESNWQQGITKELSPQSSHERSFSESEHRFIRLLESAPDGLLIIDENGGIRFCNSRISSMLGYEEEELLGEPVEILIPESKRKGHAIYRLQYQKDPHIRPMGSDLELYAKHKDGSSIPVDIMLGPFGDEGAKNIIAIIRDITKFKKAQTKLEHEKAFIQLLHDITSIANGYSDLDSVLAQSIHKICEFMGWPVGHVYLPANDGSGEFYPTDLWYMKDTSKFGPFRKMTMCTRFKPGVGMVGEVIESGKAQWYMNAHDDPGFVRRMPETDLNIRACFGLPILVQGKVHGVLEFFSDRVYPSDALLLEKMTTLGNQLGRVVERSRSEQLIEKKQKLFEHLFKHSPAGIVMLNKKEKVKSVNKSFCRIFGYTTKDLIGEKLDNKLVPERFLDQSRTINYQTFSGSSVSKETVRLHKDGTEVPVLIHTVPVKFENNIIAIYGIYVDVSEVKKTENKLRRSLKEKKLLLEEIHHRVKNNLAIITSLLELQINQADDKIAIKQLKDSQARIFSMAMVHEQLYQMESFSCLEFDAYLKKLAKKIQTTFNDPATDVQIEFQTEPIEVSLDQAVTCGQLINEVMTNAFKHAFQGKQSGLIVIYLRENDGNIELRISDNGLGISNEALNDAYNSLGLTLIYTLTEQLGGTLSIENEGGRNLKSAFQKKTTVHKYSVKINNVTMAILNQSRPFKYHELFFSITDPKSKIIYLNDVFVRISGYPVDEIVGELHNKIRHPDMPRSVFKIFWDHLNDNKPVAAYVKNLAKNGAYYWVMALAYPCDEGYMSIRLKPGSELFEKAKEIYKAVLKFEKDKEQELGKRKGMYKAEEHLLDILRDEGYSSYDEFMWDALEKEMRNRENVLKKEKVNLLESYQGVPDHLKDLQSLLGKLFARLESLGHLHDVLMEHSDYMLKLSRSILFLSLNAQVSSAKLDNAQDSITVVAENMGKQTEKGEVELIEIQEIVKKLNSLLRSLNFEIISSKLQVEMTNKFLSTLSKDENSNQFNQIITGERAIELLFTGFKPKLSSIKQSVGELPTFIKRLRNQVHEIERFLQILHYIHITGKIEASKMNKDASSFLTTFEELVREVNSAQSRLDELSEVIYNNEQTSAIFAKSQTAFKDIMTELAQ